MVLTDTWVSEEIYVNQQYERAAGLKPDPGSSHSESHSPQPATPYNKL